MMPKLLILVFLILATVLLINGFMGKAMPTVCTVGVGLFWCAMVELITYGKGASE